MNGIVATRDLHFRYNGVEILSDITFNLEKGEFLGIVGPNGSGKTTLVRIILGLLKPTSGSVELFGTDTASFTEWQTIGYLPQKIGTLNPHFPATVEEIVSLGLISRRETRKAAAGKDRRAIDDAMALMDITAIRNKLIGELSGGQQQRVLIARALVSGPQLLILDEPTTALDPEGREKFFATLGDLNRNRTVTIIMITHDIGTIGQYASRLLYLDKKLVFYGGFDAFCTSGEMTSYFGEHSQHIICHRHSNR
ncbi:MAG TPA: metal ABC transporter ATP-binding protein [Syntrophorhabdaceae bacterium]|nr:metal ABC transporter ATP-binding protein [Syntrophorhabdaceae bacterium]